jgi:hypothetical protein
MMPARRIGGDDRWWNIKSKIENGRWEVENLRAKKNPGVR